MTVAPTTTAKRVAALANLHLPNTKRLDLAPMVLGDGPPQSERITSGEPDATPGSDERVYVLGEEALSRHAPSGVFLHEHLSPSVDIIASTDTLKQVFAMPYQPGDGSSGVAIHRVGNSLVMESAHDRLRRRREQGVGSEARKISQRYKKSRRPATQLLQHLPIHYPPETSQTSSPLKTSLVNPQDDHDGSVHDTDESEDGDGVPSYELVADPETGEIFLLLPDAPQPEDRAQTTYQQVLHDRFLHDDVSRAMLPPTLPTAYDRVVHWQFDSMEMLLGNNSMLFQHAPSGDSMAVALRDVETHWTSFSCLDLWLDQVMTGIQRAAICTANTNGRLDSYHLVRTDELPILSFDPANVFQNAQSILRFLQAHCVSEATTYWLTQSPSGVCLFELPSDAIAFPSSSVDHTVGTLCLQLAAQTSDTVRAMQLYRKGLGLVDKRAIAPKTLATALVASAKLAMAPYMRPYTATRWLHTDAFVRAEDVQSQLVQALEACEAFASSPKESTKTLFEIAQQFLPQTTISAVPVAERGVLPPPMLDDEAQQKEDMEYALSLLLEAAAYVDASTCTELREALLACYYVLVHIALLETDCGLALYRLHHMLCFVDSFQSSQVPLVVAKVHLRLAMQPTDALDVVQAQYEQAVAADRAVSVAPPPMNAPLWLHMSRQALAGDAEQHLNIALTCAMQVGDYSTLPHLVVGREHIHRCFRETLRDAYVSLARHLVSTGRHTKGARHAEQGILLFTSLGDDVATLELRIVLAEVALRSGRHHKAIAGFNAALSALRLVESEYVRVLHVHLLLLLRFAHTSHALHLQQQLASEPLLNRDGQLTAARVAIRDELRTGLRFGSDALARIAQLPSRRHQAQLCAWRVADSHYLLAGFEAAYARARLAQAHDATLWTSIDASAAHYENALDTLPLDASTRVHHLLLRLDKVKFLLSVGVAAETKVPRVASVYKDALDCLLASATLYEAAPTETVDAQRVALLLRGLFQLIEQQAHVCLKHLLKLQTGDVARFKACYLDWLTHGRDRSPHATLLAASKALLHDDDDAAHATP
ncbi:hypothetical protein SPRG_02001 [Saprolegnia parasitica CBS 223.65]|uniref:EDRF1 N-terminal domain-containing protein n=1 Tax=Saprolegnia parasitica (strain CBS 223.65) TaxID=695850 RepID=A0A067CR97_SAPPC|nr:hypothetical protein SPRG_02001 [Saprolegnia parasitica CBS 223.65]KDO33189.1 hypothetical protein SPRG_02001 [Saprolegnia parasitica CBS 223.65]|eukprot:XP_012195950.1 hypothetical protein SPRG_02001 [Saprolegnia parasitica CBS 223.65]